MSDVKKYLIGFLVAVGLGLCWYGYGVLKVKLERGEAAYQFLASPAKGGGTIGQQLHLQYGVQPSGPPQASAAPGDGGGVAK